MAAFDVFIAKGGEYYSNPVITNLTISSIVWKKTDAIPSGPRLMANLYLVLLPSSVRKIERKIKLAEIYYYADINGDPTLSGALDCALGKDHSVTFVYPPLTQAKPGQLKLTPTRLLRGDRHGFCLQTVPELDVCVMDTIDIECEKHEPPLVIARGN